MVADGGISWCDEDDLKYIPLAIHSDTFTFCDYEFDITW
jgi:hypothetical protein